MQHGGFAGAARRQLLERLFVALALEQVTKRVVHAVARRQQLLHDHPWLPVQERMTDPVAVTEMPETLGSVEVREAGFLQPTDDLPGALQGIRLDVANRDAEAVSLQVPGAQLVAVEGDTRHLQPRRLDAPRILAPDARHRERLLPLVVSV